MKNKVFAKIIIIIGVLLLLASGYMIYVGAKSIDAREQSVQEIDTYLTNHVSSPFKNSAIAQTAPEQKKEIEALYSYQATETLTFLSHSEQWDDGKLKELYDELLKNKHGDEIETLHEVVVWPHEEEDALATHTSDIVNQSLEVNFGALPEDFSLDFTRNVSLITLYGGDTEDSIADMAWSLSHEYGHLYTFYYMFNPSATDLADSEYGKLRKCTENGLISAAFPDDDYYKNHYKYLLEVAANDYVQLMGSPTTREVVDYLDIQQMLNSGEDPTQEFRFSGNNANPQENLELPLASEVDGLSEYFYQFIDEKAPTPVEPRSEIKINIESDSRGYNLVDGYRDFVHYKLTWNTPYQDAVYSVVCYDSDPYRLQPIKTVQGGEEPLAIIGTVVADHGSQVTYYSDENAKGTKTFLVIAQLTDGTYYSSEPLVHTF